MKDKKKADKMFDKNSAGGKIINHRKQMDARLQEIMNSTRPNHKK